MTLGEIPIHSGATMKKLTWNFPFIFEKARRRKIHNFRNSRTSSIAPKVSSFLSWREIKEKKKKYENEEGKGRKEEKKIMRNEVWKVFQLNLYKEDSFSLFRIFFFILFFFLKRLLLIKKKETLDIINSNYNSG